MKKILILASLIIICFGSMSFRGCYQIGFQLEEFLAFMSGDYRYGDNSIGLKYTVYVGNNGKIWRSSGENNAVLSEITSPTSQRLNNIRVSPHDSFDEVVAVGNNGTIIYSLNTGTDWTASAPVTSSNLYGIDFIYGRVFAVGDNGAILSASYTGGAWDQQTSGTTRNLKAVEVSAQLDGTVIAVGEKGTILRTTDNGTTWLNVSLADTTVNFYDISQKGIYFSGSITCAVGSGGRIYKTTDKGATWQQKPSGTTNNLRKIYFNSPDSAVVVGDNGTIRFTTNAGETWFTDPYFNSPSARNYRSVALIDRDHSTFAALSDSLFFVSIDPMTTGIEPVSSEIPGEFSLSQNYPNPFNPSTKISFQLPKSSYTKLIVFDITGKEIETLVSGDLHAGVYDYEWNGISLTSGVYFYKLTAGDFTETKKMILVK
jgi:hypothetical protein